MAVSEHILLTGLPGVGKTTVVMKLIQALENYGPAGFYTEEIRESGVRRGFSLTGLDGSKAVLSHVTTDSSVRVGKYGVDILAFEKFLMHLNLPAANNRIIIIDEIGKMESLSSLFCRTITNLLSSDKVVIAAIAQKGIAFIGNIKRSPGIKIFKITHANRDNIADEILSGLRL